MSKISVMSASALLAQAELNMAMLRTILSIIESIPGAEENPVIREALIDLSKKNGAVLDKVKTVFENSNPGQNNGS